MPTLAFDVTTRRSKKAYVLEVVVHLTCSRGWTVPNNHGRSALSFDLELKQPDFHSRFC